MMIQAKPTPHYQQAESPYLDLSVAPSTSKPQAPSASHLSAQAWKLYRGSPLGTRIIQSYRPHICPFESLIPWIPETASILDVGCGSGLLLLLLASLGYKIDGIGLDRAAKPISIAQTAAMRTAARRPGMTLQFHQVQDLGTWPEQEFDVVAMVDVLHHVPPGEQETVIRQAAARVRHGGTFIYKDMCRRPLWRATANSLHDLLLAREWVHYREVSEVERWCRQSGFTLRHGEDCHRFWYGHELRVMTRA